MKARSLLLPVLLGSTIFMTACTSTPETASQAPETVSGPEIFLDASANELFKDVKKVYKTQYFALGIPQGWNVLTFTNDKLASSISVEKEDHSAVVTIRINKAEYKTLHETCVAAGKAFEANGVEFVSAPDIQYGTCIIDGKEGEKDVALWLRQYSDDMSVYSINYTGSLETVGELLGYLVGNEKLMQLMVRPL